MITYDLLLLVHLLGVVLWVGGMAFAYFFLRPALQSIEPPRRLPLLQEVLRRFLGSAGLAVLVVLASGAVMIALGADGAHIHAMAALGVVMAAVYGHVRFALYPRLVRAVFSQDWPAGGAAVGLIRLWIAINLVLGVVVIAVAVLRLPR